MADKQPEALRLASRIKYPQLVILNETLDAAAAELRRQHALIAELVGALEKLAKLGNGEHYGNSVGNQIARAALAKAKDAQ